MNLAKRLVLLLAAPLVALLVVGGILDLQLKAIEKRGTYVAELQLPSVVVIGKITRKHAELRVDLRDYLLAPGDKERATALAAFRTTEKELEQLLDQYSDALISDERDRRLLGDFRELTGQWIAAVNKLMALVAAGQRQEALDRVFNTLPALGERSHKVSGEWAEHHEPLARDASHSTVTTTSDAATARPIDRARQSC
jgi:CHASE3 domain sensor protein